MSFSIIIKACLALLAADRSKYADAQLSPDVQKEY